MYRVPRGELVQRRSSSPDWVFRTIRPVPLKMFPREHQLERRLVGYHVAATEARAALRHDRARVDIREGELHRPAPSVAVPSAGLVEECRGQRGGAGPARAGRGSERDLEHCGARRRPGM